MRTERYNTHYDYRLFGLPLSDWEDTPSAEVEDATEEYRAVVSAAIRLAAEQED